VGVLGNTSIPNAVKDVSGVLVSGLNALYASNGTVTEAVKTALSSGLEKMAGSVSGIKSAFSKTGDSISSALSSALYSGVSSIVSALGGLSFDRNVGGGVGEGTAPDYEPPILPPEPLKPPASPEYPNKTNLGTTMTDKEFYDWAEKEASTSKENIPTVDSIKNADKKANANMSVNPDDAFKYKGQVYWSVGNGLYIKQADVNSYNIRDYGASGRAGYWHTKYEVVHGADLYKKYKTGGLADYTGPAWLDGTKSKPELVLD
jgi:hypothetical protein